jgi:DNA-binding SARP family transcriptional activator
LAERDIDTPIRICLFGTVEVAREGRVLPPFPTHKSKLLFAYLVLHRDRLHPREVLSGLLWGERPEDVARTRLRTELWRLRSTLESGAASVAWLTFRKNAVGFTPSVPCWVDVEAFERRVRDALRDTVDPYAWATGHVLAEACALYRGDLLEGEYDAWCQDDQSRLRALYVDALEGLVWNHVAHKQWHQAARRARELLAHDPLREDIHRSLLALYYGMGNRARALSQFRECRERLLEDLGVEPMRCTVRLHEALRREDERELLDAVVSVVPPLPDHGAHRSDPIRASPAYEPARALLELTRSRLGLESRGPADPPPAAQAQDPARDVRRRRWPPSRRLGPLSGGA